MKKVLIISLSILLFSCNSEVKTENKEIPIREINAVMTDNDRKIDSLIALMSLEEKVAMLHGNSMFTSAGVERLGIPELKMADGPLGIREELHRDSWGPLGLTDDFATFFPAGGGLSATWNPELAKMYGVAIAQEARARNKDVLLAPAINIIRTPLGGRNFEYFSEDPYLCKTIIAPYVTGVQSQDVAVCVKHFAVNNQETNRGTVDVLMDERTLREIYLPAFKASIEAGAYTVMGAYNKFRGDYLCENDYMLNGILKGEWGFKGIVISDWAAVHSSVKSLKNGLDVEMGSPLPFESFYLAKPLMDSIAAGKIEEKVIDEKVKRILRVMFAVKSIDPEGRVKGSINTVEHKDLVYKIASESVILLKNSENILPVQTSKIKSIAVIGDNATRKHAAGGFGAGVKTKNEISPLQGLKNKLPAGVTIHYAQGYKENYTDADNKNSFGRSISNEADPGLVAEAIAAARKSDVAIIFAGSNRTVESEAADRINIDLPFGQEELIRKVKEANPNTIVVIIAGAPFDLKEVQKYASALVWSWFNGNEAGNALADILLGNVNPSGKLPWTLPKNLMDSPAHATLSFPGAESVTYKEGIFVGYRWFDAKNIEPLYPFGYGLSYTSFDFSDLKTDKQNYGQEESIQVSFSIKNTGITDGKEVAQLYVSHPGSTVEKADKELKAYKKVFVQSGATVNATIGLPAKELAYYNDIKKEWTVEPGVYIIKIGKSSREIVSEISIEIK